MADLGTVVRAIIDSYPSTYERKQYRVTREDAKRGYAMIDGRKYPYRGGIWIEYIEDARHG